MLGTGEHLSELLKKILTLKKFMYSRTHTNANIQVKVHWSNNERMKQEFETFHNNRLMLE